MSFRKIMAIVFGVGVFVTGIGIGVTFSEYSTFSYGAETGIYEDQMVTDVISMDVKKGVDSIRYAEYSEAEQIEIVADPTVAEDQIVFELTYNKAFIHPYVKKESHTRTGEAATDIYCINMGYRRSVTDFQMVMDSKDIVLEGLKNRTFVELKGNYDYSCKIRTSPNNTDKLVRVFL